MVRLAVIHRNEQVRRPGGAEGEEEEERKDYFAHGMKVVQETQKSGRECGGEGLSRFGALVYRIIYHLDPDLLADTNYKNCGSLWLSTPGVYR